MHIKTIALSLAIQSLEPGEDDDLIDRLIESSPQFQALLSKSNAGTRKPLLLDDSGQGD